MNKNIEVLFVGFSDDYDLLQIEELKKHYKVSVFIASNIVCFLNSNFGKNKIIRMFISNYFYNRLSSLPKDAVVICIDKPIYLKYLNVIDNKCGVLFRNTYDPNCFPIEFIENKLCFSFDHNDCDNFNFIYYNQYINQDKSLLPKAKIINNDFYFIGMDKGRREIVENLVNKLKEINPEFRFSINIKREPKNKLEKYLSNLFYNKHVTHIPYHKNLEYISSSNVVIDIVKNGQTGITLKALEALIYGKKLITNNSMITNYDFYNDKQIYILNEQDDEYRRLDFFLKNKIDNKINIENYSMKNVFDKIISKIKG